MNEHDEGPHRPCPCLFMALLIVGTPAVGWFVAAMLQ